jgi:hypothetical protein
MLSLIFSIYIIASVLSYFVDNKQLNKLKQFNNNLIDKILEKVDKMNK